MKKNFLPLLFLLLVLDCGFIYAQTSINVMSFNIRYDSPGDIEKGYGWPKRKSDVVALIRHYDPDLLGVQEAMKHQLDYILGELPEYSLIGVGRDDGKEKGEYSAILYKANRFKKLKDDTFWLSTTPDKPSKSWDAALPRIATWGYFEEKATGQKFYYFNTHFDHRGKQARLNSARLLLDKAESIAEDASLIISGDFNVTPDTEPYRVLTSELKDSRELTATPPYGPHGTFSGFQLTPSADLPRIDYVFVNSFEVNQYEVIADFFNDKFPSDHLPVLVRIEFK